jgi:hypothetical protein
VTRRRALLVAILVYVSLDLSLAMMPGAFVFDPGDSVESLHVRRASATPELAAVPAPAREGLVLVKASGEVSPRPAASAERHDRRVVPRLNRPPADSAPASEDPH